MRWPVRFFHKPKTLRTTDHGLNFPKHESKKTFIFISDIWYSTLYLNFRLPKPMSIQRKLHIKVNIKFMDSLLAQMEKVIMKRQYRWLRISFPLTLQSAHISVNSLRRMEVPSENLTRGLHCPGDMCREAVLLIRTSCCYDFAATKTQNNPK